MIIILIKYLIWLIKLDKVKATVMYRIGPNTNKVVFKNIAEIID